MVRLLFGMTKEMMCEMISGRSRSLLGGGCVEPYRRPCIESTLSSLRNAIAAELCLEEDESEGSKDLDCKMSRVALRRARRSERRLNLNISRN